MADFDIASIKDILKELDNGLASIGLEKNLYICGGAAIMLLGKRDRATSDIDVVDPFFNFNEPDLCKIADIVSEKFGLEKYWLNNQVEGLKKYFPKNWMDESTEVYSGKSLRVFIIPRQSLINSKFDAMLNRIADDEDDLIWLKPTKKELNVAKKYVLEKNKNIPEQLIKDHIAYILGESDDQ